MTPLLLGFGSLAPNSLHPAQHPQRLLRDPSRSASLFPHTDRTPRSEREPCFPSPASQPALLPTWSGLLDHSRQAPPPSGVCSVWGPLSPTPHSASSPLPLPTPSPPHPPHLPPLDLVHGPLPCFLKWQLGDLFVLFVPLSVSSARRVSLCSRWCGLSVCVLPELLC